MEQMTHNLQMKIGYSSITLKDGREIKIYVSQCNPDWVTIEGEGLISAPITANMMKVKATG